MERPLYRPSSKPNLIDLVLQGSGVDIDAAVLFDQHLVDRAILTENIRTALHDESQISLRSLLERFPLEHGLAELVAYLDIGSTRFKTTIDEATEDIVFWEVNGKEGRPTQKQAKLARLIFVR